MEEGIAVYDGLDSNDPTAALSKKQGKVLYEMITNIATDEDIDVIFM